MKKFLMLLLVAILTFAFTANAEQLGDTALSVTLPEDMEACDLDEDDIDDGVVAIYINDAETLEMVVYAYEAETSLEEYESTLKDEENASQIGMTNINGIDALFIIDSEDGNNYITYFIIDGDTEINVEFCYADEAAAKLSADIMNTLTK